MTATITRRRDVDFDEFFELRGRLAEYAAGVAAVERARVLDSRVRCAARDRAAYSERAFETAAAEYAARHVGTPVPAPSHETARLWRLRLDMLETRMAARELCVPEPHGDEAPARQGGAS